MHPEIHLNGLSVLLAVVSSFVFGWLWHGPLFGKLWIKLMKIPAEVRPSPKMMIRSMLLGIFGTLLTTYVLVFSTNIWRPSVWHIGADDVWYIYGFCSGFFTWLGFYVPVFLNAVAWECRSGKLFVFNIIYHFLNLQIIAMILAYMY